MNNVIAINTARNVNATELTMSSRQIAELTGKRHSNVKRDIRTMLEQLEIDTLSFEHTYFDESNRPQVEYHLDETLTITLVSGYSTALRYKVVEEWKAMKAEISKPMPKVKQGLPFERPDFYNPLEAARAWMTQVEQNQTKSYDMHSLTRLLGGNKLARRALNALTEAGYLVQQFDEDGKPNGYIPAPVATAFCIVTKGSDNGRANLFFGEGVLDVLVDLGVIDINQKGYAQQHKPMPHYQTVVQQRIRQIDQPTLAAILDI
ncbi:Rha family transcriptional regulator [Edwardsiella tarda]|uniref:Uncharacterized protein n=1 Tax=Edwardsiella tarda TaxID=636 RepID=A0A2A7U793_EDWTA|nr:Rha family transcriptional regulator [Edwardsiella tarda]PEH74282.1 hypothetical protein CRM76_01170 [Edwardsiella tarda]